MNFESEDEPDAADGKCSTYDKIYQVVREIPPGRVATYGQIAEIVGLGGARQVGYAMAAVKARDIPWQRVLNSRGQVSVRAAGVPDTEQRRLLTEEGVVFDARGRVDFELVGWSGPDIDWLDDNGFFPALRPWNRR
ncbi:MAG: cysteine methyltransferase [Thiotrichales bacterium]|nr:cysteine methyltransferase [Thiotrichales bacterium]